MGRRPNDPRVTDLRRYRRERERAARAPQKQQRLSGDEPLLGPNRKGAVFVILVVVVLAALSWFAGHR
jgi:hypothetical protein